MKIQGTEENIDRFTGENICIDDGMTLLMIYHEKHRWSYNVE